MADAGPTNEEGVTPNERGPPPKEWKHLVYGPRETILVGVDIEKAGTGVNAHPVVSVGVAVMKGYNNLLRDGSFDANEPPLSKFRLNLQCKWFVPGGDCGDFEPDRVRAFWNNINECSPDVWRVLQEAAVPQKEGFQFLARWLDGLEDTYPSEQYRIEFVSDNPSFDIGTLDSHLERYTGRRPLRYATTGRYRSVMNPDDMLWSFPYHLQEDGLVAISKVVTHDHLPDNDAHEHVLRYKLACALKDRIADVYYAQVPEYDHVEAHTAPAPEEARGAAVSS